MADEVWVEDVDEQDSDATEKLIAALLLRALLSSDPGSAAPIGLTGEAAWHAITTAAIGAGLTAFITRSAWDFLNSLGMPSATAARVIDEVVPRTRDEMIGQIAGGLEGVYGAAGKPSPSRPANRPAHQDSAELYRRIRVGSARLAQTGTTRAREMVRANLAAGMGATQQTWRTRKDDRVRMSHGALEGETRPVGEPFVTVNGARLLYPGDPEAPIGETANCRCHLTYLVPTTTREFQLGDSVVELSSPGVGPDIREERVVPV